MRFFINKLEISLRKTIFCNAFANYHVYNTLDEAIESPLQGIILP